MERGRLARLRSGPLARRNLLSGKKTLISTSTLIRAVKRQVRANRGWYSRGYLPHIDLVGRPQFLTWREADSVPNDVIAKWASELKELKPKERARELASQIEKYCDSEHGQCILKEPRHAQIMQETLFHDHGLRYWLHAWCIMPNHVHTLLTPFPGAPLERILRTLKCVSATKINKSRGAIGQLFQSAYFDRFARDEEHLHRLLHYIEWNPVKAGLCTDPKRWEFSSANDNTCARLELLTQKLRQELPGKFNASD
jgi:REP element-mobilizing transposase RayT